MKRLIFLICVMAAWNQVNAQTDKRLAELGMENIRMVKRADGTVAAFEDRIYRNSYEGVGKAIEAALDGSEEGSICLVVTDDNGMPKLKIDIDKETVTRYRNGECTLREVYATMGLSTDADKELALLKGQQTQQRSSWRPDLVVYPQLFLENTSLDKLYRYSISLAPAMEMPLWKGAELTAQVIIPIVGNQKGELAQVRPGVVALSQHFYLKHNWRMNLTAGQFTDHRMGGQVTAGWQSQNGRWEAGGKAGITVYSIFDNEGWTITRKPKINASVYGRSFIPCWNTEVTLEAGRYVYEDYGMQGSVIRHFGEYTVGLYGIYTEGKVNGGFTLAVPLPGKKYKRWKGMRIKPADYFSYTYTMTAWGEYVDRNLGYTFHTVPGENRSKGFYQPDYVRYFLLKTTE